MDVERYIIWYTIISTMANVILYCCKVHFEHSWGFFHLPGCAMRIEGCEFCRTVFISWILLLLKTCKALILESDWETPRSDRV